MRCRNLVPLFGYCVAKGEKLLIYMHMPNGTLYEKLHVVESDGNSIDWPKRLKIAIAAARGLAWLHHICNPRVIHSNVSSKCILLNEYYEPRIAEFGLARLVNPLDTHLSTFVNGDFGVLELVSGQKPVEVENVHESFKGNLVDWISKLSKHDKERPSMHEVHHLLRAIGENYNFSDQHDDMPIVSDAAECDYSNELIVAIQPK
ncbi:hypothetical protein SUGI_1520930 [Cryptomeria japonica]|uniref:Protein kinase domain-containing protein n=1 Tax=Cryptomeria japonica TaxID=3369 RepID=A0AAD3NW38_CRYJA|nr:hypothetical protein SUGI_1520930 [Cryptomeria japonica]